MRNYEALKDMAAAHLENVKRKIAEINAQKQVIDEEITKLVQYYETNVKELNDDSV